MPSLKLNNVQLFTKSCWISKSECIFCWKGVWPTVCIKCMWIRFCPVDSTLSVKIMQASLPSIAFIELLLCIAACNGTYLKEELEFLEEHVKKLLLSDSCQVDTKSSTLYSMECHKWSHCMGKRDQKQGLFKVCSWQGCAKGGFQGFQVTSFCISLII